MKNWLKNGLSLLIIALACIATAPLLANPIIPGGVDTTPESYVVSIHKVEFLNSDGEYITFVEGVYSFDIASVGAGQNVGKIGQGKLLPPGDYIAQRVTISRSFGLRGSVEDAGASLPARTAAGNLANVTLGGISMLAQASTDGHIATTQTVPVPSSPAISALLAAQGIIEVGPNELQITRPISFSIGAVDPKMPNVRIMFDLQNAIEFFNASTPGGVVSVVLPKRPSTTITVMP